MERRILCVGALTLDRIAKVPALPSGPGKYLATDLVSVPAGMASSAAISVARLGGAVSLLAAVGDDHEADVLIGAMQGHGIDCSRIVRVPGASSATALNIVDARGERIIVPYYAPVLIGSHPTSDSVRGLAAVLVDARWPNAAIAMLRAARVAGIPAVFDCDVASAETLLAIAPHASHIVASREGAAIVTGDADPRLAAAGLALRYATTVVVTDGARGSYFSERGESEVEHVPAFAVDAVDTLAAGDVFHGAFMLALCAGEALRDAIVFASAAAAIKCTRFGGISGAPTRAEVDAFLAERGEVRQAG